MTERKSKRKVVILRYFLTEIICCDVHVCWLYRVRQLNTLLKNRRKVFLCWGFVRNVYLLDRWLVKGPGKPWDRGSWGKKKVPTIRSQAAGKHSETVGLHAWRGRLRFATWVIRSSGSASLKQPFQAWRERMITTWKLDLEAWRTRRFGKLKTGRFEWEENLRSSSRDLGRRRLLAEGMEWHPASSVRALNEKRMPCFVERSVFRPQE